jgi:hypothetical protein
LGLERELEQYFMHFYFYNIYSPNIFLRQKWQKNFKERIYVVLGLFETCY